MNARVGPISGALTGLKRVPPNLSGVCDPTRVGQLPLVYVTGGLREIPSDLIEIP